MKLEIKILNSIFNEVYNYVNESTLKTLERCSKEADN